MTEAEIDPSIRAVEDAEWLAGSNLSDVARLALAERTRRAGRSRHLPAAALGGPAWDLLLEVFAERAAGRDATFASVCEGAGVTPAVALRCICVLEAEGLLVQRRDPRDRRSVWLDLSDHGMDRMCAYFREVSGHDGA